MGVPQVHTGHKLLAADRHRLPGLCGDPRLQHHGLRLIAVPWNRDLDLVHVHPVHQLVDAVDEGVLAANQKVEDEKARQILMKAASELLDTETVNDEASVASKISDVS